MSKRRDFIKKASLASGALAVSSMTSANSVFHHDTNQNFNNSPAKSPSITLNNGVEMPVLGVGSFALPTIQAAENIAFALQNGYRLVDTATNYGNEKEVGEGIKRSGINRSELFITTKLWIEDYGYDNAIEAFENSLNLLGLDYLDLYILHWPVPTDFDKTVQAYKALEKLYADKKIRAIGVSNFTPEHLENLMSQTSIVPAVNQVELHPYLIQKELRDFHKKHGIVTESWGPIGGELANSASNPTTPIRLLQDYTIVKLAEKYKKVTAQIVLRWHIQKGLIAIPKSQHYERLLYNINIFDFELSAEDMSAIDNLNKNLHGGPLPNLFDVPAFKKIIAGRKNKIQG
ncbi:Tat (twin-arginine translocation) pathway signal sequence [Pustulibacterium marinum]|uniref:Tat (Twin-arginine translocation) pathway signal sequence n=1 Tax=Pustulibacterium marinum TaxID=1224947 RepID=A0A1I7I9D7_9FLAO|nr:aldo/keto reductase [Pustulibacterium marinum]SFU69528.1 Tat (twin-arginine translocation) pathway signal sequence [Pustulibacterium marinum]